MLNVFLLCTKIRFPLRLLIYNFVFFECVSTKFNATHRTVREDQSECQSVTKNIFVSNENRLQYLGEGTYVLIVVKMSGHVSIVTGQIN
jgi:hypothetical protein